jgi:hypothetical protein
MTLGDELPMTYNPQVHWDLQRSVGLVWSSTWWLTLEINSSLNYNFFLFRDLKFLQFLQNKKYRGDNSNFF